MNRGNKLPGTRSLVITAVLGLAVLIAGPVAWAVLAKADGAVAAVAVVRTSQPVETVSHAKGGIIASIEVADGSAVAPGDALVTLDNRDALAQVASLGASYRSARVVKARLLAEQSDQAEIHLPPDLQRTAALDPELRTEIAGQQALILSRMAETRAARQQGELASQWAERRIRDLSARIALVRRELALLDADKAAQQALVDQGVTSRRSLRDSSRSVLRLQDRLAELNGQISDIGAQAELRRAALDLQDAQRRKDVATQLQQVRARLAELGPRLTAAKEALAAATIRAHVAGRVQLSPQAALGSVVRPAEPMMLIVPDAAGQRLVAEIPASAINRVTTGQPVRVQRHPVDGLAEVRAGVVDAIAVQAVRSQGGAVFAVTILPDVADPHAFDGLHPGQTVTVFLHTKARPIADYLLEPFLQFFSRALRES